MNIDAVIVARYFYHCSDEVKKAMEQAYDEGTEPAVTLADYINVLPKEVWEAMKRICEVPQ